MRLSSKKTLPVIHYILENTSFKQIEIQKNTGISIGRINKIITWLIDKNVVIKENAKYSLICPHRLIELLSDQITIKTIMTYSVNMSLDELKKKLKKKGILCLGSALDHHQKNKTQDSIHIYDNQEIKSFLNTIERGNLQVHIYTPPYDVQSEKGFTTKIQTAMDLIARRESHLSKNLGLKIWKTLQ